MQQIKKIVHFFLGNNSYGKLSLYKQRFISLPRNFYLDYLLYKKHSIVFEQDTFNKIETLIILKYHSLEKGLLHKEIKHQFGKQYVIELCQLLKRKDVISKRHRTQIAAAYLALCSYYESHVEHNIDISSYFDEADYDLFKEYSVSNLSSVKEHQLVNYFENSDKDFYHFSNSRCSVRDFTGDKIPFDTIQNVIELAKNAPSVCNRQPVKVYYIDDKKNIDNIFAIQKGLKGHSDEVSQLLVVVSDRNYFYSVGERNQLYIDGGIFLMNLLYALHYYKVAACPAHWGLNNDSDKKVNNLLNMSDSEKVICLVAVGIPQDKFKTALSLRRSTDEILMRVPIR
ncbi:nitroreductase family protein [Methylobacter svalbardensis]|uniref:nitroreductase family protein n=1 Tax=Methylobacter svalbardensis TaxID=3080016 RepID=UPI0030EC4CF5